MTHKVKPEILMLGSEQFPRCVVIDSNAPEQPMFWSGHTWVSELRKAMLFADDEALERELSAILSRS